MNTNLPLWITTAVCSVTLAIGIAMLVIGLTSNVHAAPSEPVPCLPLGKAGNEVLYFCESDYGLDCVWDPSEILGAGVVDCDW